MSKESVFVLMLTHGVQQQTLVPRISRSFMTATNSLWLSFPSPSTSNSWNTTWTTWLLSDWPVQAFTARRNSPMHITAAAHSEWWCRREPWDIKRLSLGEWQWQRKYVCITINELDTKYNPNPNPTTTFRCHCHTAQSLVGGIPPPKWPTLWQVGR